MALPLCAGQQQPHGSGIERDDKDKKNSTLTEVFNVKAFDGHDYSAPSTLSITVKGTNDAPTITLHQGSGVAGSGASLRMCLKRKGTQSGQHAQRQWQCRGPRCG